MILKPGKLYKVVTSHGVNAIKEELLGAGTVGGATKMEKDKIFLFIETVEKDLSTFSKIILDDKVMITYNGYLLARDIVEVIQ